MQRWRGTPLAKLQVSTKKEAACAKRWHRFHAKVLDHTMVNLPKHASSDFVAELSELIKVQTSRIPSFKAFLNSRYLHGQTRALPLSSTPCSARTSPSTILRPRPPVTGDSPDIHPHPLAC